MLTRDMNERLTRVGPGTPGGALLRRYWYPIVTVPDLDADPVLPITLRAVVSQLLKDHEEAERGAEAAVPHDQPSAPKPAAASSPTPLLQ